MLRYTYHLTNLQLESRIIYENAKVYSQKVSWEKPKDSIESEWVYIGIKDNMESITTIIQDFFITNQLYVAFTRNASFELDTEFIFEKIQPLAGRVNFSVWDASFQNVIEFNIIGVYRTGRRNAASLGIF